MKFESCVYKGLYTYIDFECKSRQEYELQPRKRNEDDEYAKYAMKNADFILFLYI
jgi:hypothetical protein